MSEQEVMRVEDFSMSDFEFVFVKIDGKWMAEEDAVFKCDAKYIEMIEEIFSVKVSAENLEDAERKIDIIAKVIWNGGRPGILVGKKDSTGQIKID